MADTYYNSSLTGQEIENALLWVDNVLEEGVQYADMSSGVKASLNKADTALQTAPVTSVNNKTGIVTLNATDVGALANNTTYVSTVNGNGGAITITAAGIQAIPAPSSANTGDVLTYSNNEWTAAAPDPGLPAVTTTDNGKVLSVVSGEWAAAMPDPGLPAVTSSDNGKVLTVVSGVWAAADLPLYDGSVSYGG